ncbi:MAG: hypothetical protein RBT49_01610 [Bacteroidales bacterium]|jgi:hypothetical protein|nr:hypothetical protein [Bacteroidales bacterium]
MISWINIFLIYSFIGLADYHPIHVSVANIEYSKDLNKLTVSVKLFEDDFRLLFFHLNQVEVDLKIESNFDKYNDLIKSYFQDHFKLISNNGEILNLEITSWKINEDAIWFHFDSKVENEIKSLKISNSLLLDLYFDQKNLVIVKTSKRELGFQFDYKTTEKVIILK